MVVMMVAVMLMKVVSAVMLMVQVVNCMHRTGRCKRVESMLMTSQKTLFHSGANGHGAATHNRFVSSALP